MSPPRTSGCISAEDRQRAPEGIGCRECLPSAPAQDAHRRIGECVDQRESQPHGIVLEAATSANPVCRHLCDSSTSKADNQGLVACVRPRDSIVRDAAPSTALSGDTARRKSEGPTFRKVARAPCRSPDPDGSVLGCPFVEEPERPRLRSFKLIPQMDDPQFGRRR